MASRTLKPHKYASVTETVSVQETLYTSCGESFHLRRKVNQAKLRRKLSEPTSPHTAPEGDRHCRSDFSGHRIHSGSVHDRPCRAHSSNSSHPDPLVSIQ